MYKKLLSIILLFTIINTAFAGKHIGEQKMINSSIKFLNSAGLCIANSNGLTYIINGSIFTNNSAIYIPEYWNEYPLYLPGANVYAQITVTNTGPRAKAKLSAKMEAYVINLDGSNGAPLIIPPQVLEFEVARGETRVINSTFKLPPAGKNLNRFVLKLYHHQNASNDASLIMEKEGVFCPPEDLQ